MIPLKSMEWKGYDSAECFCETFPVIANDKVIKGYKRLLEYPMYITLYNLFNPVTCLYRSMLEIAYGQNHNLSIQAPHETYHFPNPPNP